MHISQDLAPHTSLLNQQPSARGVNVLSNCDHLPAASLCPLLPLATFAVTSCLAAISKCLLNRSHAKADLRATRGSQTVTDRILPAPEICLIPVNQTGKFWLARFVLCPNSASQVGQGLLSTAQLYGVNGAREHRTSPIATHPVPGSKIDNFFISI